jgi:hypothetical protein
VSGQPISREDKIALYSKIIANQAGVELKGDTIPYTSLNGHMYSYLSKENVFALRLPETARAEFIEQYKTTLMIAYGIIQKEYVVVPDALLVDTVALIPWFQRSFAYVNTLKPKPATKGKKK